MKHTQKPAVSVVIPTCNRPEFLPRAINSVLTQTYQDFEILVVDDGMKVRSEVVVVSFKDPRIRYIKNEKSLGGGGTRNRGVSEARGEFIAFLDDDDEWVPQKLAVQMSKFSAASRTVGFCFSAVVNVYNDREEITHVESGIFDFSQIALTRFKGFLTSTLVIRRTVFSEVGGFDASLPSHQEPELIIRMTRKYKGISINEPLARMNMTPREHIGGSLERRIRGREMLLAKHGALYAGKSRLLARHYFQIGLWCRNGGDSRRARKYFFHAFRLSGNPRYLFHAFRVLFRVSKN